MVSKQAEATGSRSPTLTRPTARISSGFAAPPMTASGTCQSLKPSFPEANPSTQSTIPMHAWCSVGPGISDFDTMSINGRRGFFSYGRAAREGDWTTDAFSAASYSANNFGSWSVRSEEQARPKYTRIGHTMTLNFCIDSSKVSGEPRQLSIRLPESAVKAAGATCFIYDGTGAIGKTWIAAGSSVLSLAKANDDGLNAGHFHAGAASLSSAPIDRCATNALSCGAVDEAECVLHVLLENPPTPARARGAAARRPDPGIPAGLARRSSRASIRGYLKHSCRTTARDHGRCATAPPAICVRPGDAALTQSRPGSKQNCSESVMYLRKSH